MTGGTLLAIDIGSSSVRAMVCDRQGVAIAAPARVTYQFTRTPDGGALLTPDAVCEAVFGCIDAALAACAGPVAAVAVDTFVTSVIGIGADGQPTTPLYTWADGRGGELLPRLAERLAPDAYHQRTGCHLHPSYWPLRLTWLRAADPEAFGATHRWLSLGAYLMWRLCGRAAMSISDAAWTGLLDRHALAWDAEALAAAGLSADRLPEIDGRAAPLTGEAVRRWPLLAGACWHPAIGDGAAANIGAGCTQPHQVALTIGTSGAVRAVVDGTPQHVPAGLFCYRIDAARSLVGGAVSNAGSVHHWLSHTLATTAGDHHPVPDAHGLTVIPFLTPERSPYWDDSLPSAFIGMTPATTPADMLHASLEAVAFGFARIMARLLPLLPQGVSITANGGAAVQSPVLMQMLADAIGQPVAVASQPEATIRGAALFVSGETSAPEAPAAIYRPDPTHTALYAAAMDRQQRAIDALRGFRGLPPDLTARP